MRISYIAAILLLALPANLFAIPHSPLECETFKEYLFSAGQSAISASGANVITQTLTVSGERPFIWDLNVAAVVSHTSSGDLDITLTSPSGTVVTLTTDNAEGRANGFLNAIFDDNQNAGGQVPYTNNENQGLVTDRTYIDTPPFHVVVPEEPLAAFFGEDPNGIWTLTISDDTAGAGGELDHFELRFITGAPSVSFRNFTKTSTTTPINISSAAASSITDTVTIPVGELGDFICDVDVITSITHTQGSDLDITLTSPGGQIATLTTDNGAGFDNVFANILWDNSANPGGQVPYTSNNELVTDRLYSDLSPTPPQSSLTPEESFEVFSGGSPSGIWTLKISDDAPGDGGTLNSWSIKITTCDQADADDDGRADECDQCPDDEFKVEPGACGCGAFDGDSDSDGTLDCNETCPDDPDKLTAGVCGCGVPDVDTDGDGTFNCVDSCAQDPLKVLPGSCGCGQNETDSDSDGTANCIDGCPTDNDKIAVGACGCGNSDIDANGNGTADCLDPVVDDFCPNDPTKFAPGACGCGVPDLDNNQNQIADCRLEADIAAQLLTGQSVLKSVKLSFPKKKAKAQKELRAKLKKLTAEIVNVINLNATGINTVSASIDLNKLSTSLKSTVSAALKRTPDSFSKDKAAATKAFKALIAAIQE